MSIKKINLRKLLQLFYADDRRRRTLLLEDIRRDRRKKTEGSSNGGDFFAPFWADVKEHAAGRSNLAQQTKIRIDANKGRERLYPLLSESFLSMWNEKMRWKNEPFEFIAGPLNAQLSIVELDAAVKVENVFGIRMFDGTHRVIYPYFYEDPTLPIDGAQLGFWALQKALTSYELDEFRIVDLLRRTYFRPVEIGLRGDEDRRFIRRYTDLLAVWEKLKSER